MNILFAPYAAKLPGGGPSPKNYPWPLALAKQIEAKGHNLLQVGSGQEMQVASNMERNRSFKEICEMLRECDTFIGVDSFLQHAAWFVGKHGIVLWGPSDPDIFGHKTHVNLLRDREFLRQNQFEMWTQTHASPEAFVRPEIVLFHVERIAQERGL